MNVPFLRPKSPETEKPKLKWSRLRNSRKPLPYSGLGRHAIFYNWLETRWKPSKTRKKFRIVVAGVGGGRDGGVLSHQKATEHAELGLVFHRMGIPFELTAMDIHPEAVAEASNQLRSPLTYHRGPNLFLPNEPKLEEYLDRLFPGQKGPDVSRDVPKQVRESIRIRGPGLRGDVTSPLLQKENDLVAAFNLSMYFNDADKRKLARHLIAATKDDGLIATKSIQPDKDAFIAEFKHQLGEHNLVADLENLWGEGRILIFKKDARRMRK